MNESNVCNIVLPIDLTNPGQFFACCGLLEIASRLDQRAEGWFDDSNFYINGACSIQSIFALINASTVANTMSKAQLSRLDELSAMTKKQRESISGLDDEKEQLESMRRELPIVIDGGVTFHIDWFRDDFSGGSRFKTWAGQQSVLNIARTMHSAIPKMSSIEKIWDSVRDIGLPFNFDSDLGGQGSARDVGFSFDPLADNKMTRIEGSCKPALEFLCFIGLQRFRPAELKGENRFVYVAWSKHVPVSVASALACGAIDIGKSKIFSFKLLYRTKYLKSFLPAQPIHGETDE
jgi:CRISPR-associated protein Csb3